MCTESPLTLTFCASTVLFPFRALPLSRPVRAAPLNFPPQEVAKREDLHAQPSLIQLPVDSGVCIALQSPAWLHTNTLFPSSLRPFALILPTFIVQGFQIMSHSCWQPSITSIYISDTPEYSDNWPLDLMKTNWHLFSFIKFLCNIFFKWTRVKIVVKKKNSSSVPHLEVTKYGLQGFLCEKINK